jgi:alkanesulfonate monooxygenase SsuD/methylene tetrahydromethanopterin reductase-like flavin-dependent oxidoreductase (luciferase family)
MKIYFNACYVRPENMMVAAQTLERVGFHGLTVPDHLVYPKDLGSSYPYDYDLFPPDTPWSDPWVLMAHLAAGTEKLRFTTAIYLLALRNPFQAAKSIATAAILSDYRVDVGFANGWMQAEFEVLGQPYKGRAGRVDEMIEVMRKLWQGGWTEHEGEHYSFPTLQMSPAPAEKIRIWGGGDQPKALRRAASLDGFVGAMYDLDGACRVVESLDAARREAGTDGRQDYEVMCGYITGDSALPGLDECRALEQMGYTSVFVAPWETSFPPTNADPGREALLDSIERFGDEVIAKM